MSGNNPYARNPGGNKNRNDGNDSNRNTTNGTGNNGGDYHLLNPYSPQFKRKQQQHQQQQQQQQQSNHPRYTPNQSNSGDSRQPFNPYAPKTQQQQQSPNRYSNTGNRNSFAIGPARSQWPQDRTYSPVEQQQQQPGQEQSYQDNTNRGIGNNSNNNHLSSNPVQSQATHQHQQQQPPQQAQTQKEAQDQKLLLAQLRDQLDQSTESNFELEASVVALGAELQHTTKTLTEQAELATKKLEHELRLAQQESKRWKLLAQQQKEKQGRSIVRDAVAPAAAMVPAATAPAHLAIPTTTNAFSNRLLGNPAGLQPQPFPEPPEKVLVDSRIFDEKKIHEEELQFPTGNLGTNSDEHSKTSHPQNSQSRRNRPSQPQDLPLARLARTLLEQLEPSTVTAFTFNSQRDISINNNKQSAEERSASTSAKAKASKPASVSTSTSTPTDVKKGGKDDQKNLTDNDSSIRRVLLSIASAARDTGKNNSNRISNPNENGDLDDRRAWQQASPPTPWTVGKLAEWLVRKSSSESSDRYWSALLFQSPEARKHVVECVGLDWEDQQEQRQQQHSFGGSHQQPLRRRRRDRIRPIFTGENTEHEAAAKTKLEERQQQIRQSLRNPWWDPNDKATRDYQYSDRNTDGSAVTATTNPNSSLPSSSLVFRKWVMSLAASWNLGHLQTLRVLLAEAAGRKSLANSAGEKSISESGAWWALCYPSIATTIQRIAYRKKMRSKRNKKKKQSSSGSTNSNNSNRSNTPRNAASATNNDVSHRYRVGKFEDRLARLPKAGSIVIIAPQAGSIEKGTTAAMDIDKDGITARSSKDPWHNLQNEGSVRKLPSSRSDAKKGKACFGSEEEEEDNVLALALSIWVGLLQVATTEQLKSWYGDRKGLGLDEADRLWQKKTKKMKEIQNPSPPPCGGLFMVCLLLDVLEELQFDRWMCRDDSDNANVNVNANPMSLSSLLSTGVLQNEMNYKARKSKNKGTKHSPGDAASRGKKEKHGSGDDGRDTLSPSESSSSSTLIPQWYDAAIAVFSQIGRTPDGMKTLRTRAMNDPEHSDWMGNALDVSIRQLHIVVLHLDDFRTRHGSILRFGESTSGGKNSHESDAQAPRNANRNRFDLLWEGDPQGPRLLRSVEAWVRLWHQVLMYAQSKEGISFRSLVLDLQDWFTSSYAILLTSEEVREEIRVMIRWQLDELMMDEEDYEESKRRAGLR